MSFIVFALRRLDVKPVGTDKLISEIRHGVGGTAMYKRPASRFQKYTLCPARKILLNHGAGYNSRRNLKHCARSYKGIGLYLVDSVGTVDKMQRRVHMSTVVKPHIDSVEIVSVPVFQGSQTYKFRHRIALVNLCRQNIVGNIYYSHNRVLLPY